VLVVLGVVVVGRAGIGAVPRCRGRLSGLGVGVVGVVSAVGVVVGVGQVSVVVVNSKV
jgi:hypothetical protein